MDDRNGAATVARENGSGAMGAGKRIGIRQALATPDSVKKLGRALIAPPAPTPKRLMPTAQSAAKLKVPDIWHAPARLVQNPEAAAMVVDLTSKIVFEIAPSNSDHTNHKFLLCQPYFMFRD